MAKIILSIEADNADDLRTTLAELAGEGFDGDDTATGDAAPAAPPKNRGGRPPKNRAAAPPPAAGATEVQQQVPAGSAAGPTSDPVAASDDPLAAAIAAQAAAGAGNGGAVTKEHVTAALSSAITAASPLKVKERLEAAGLPYSMSKMTDDDYPKVHAVLQAIVAEGGAS